jgi:hypothetical protein
MINVKKHLKLYYPTAIAQIHRDSNIYYTTGRQAAIESNIIDVL